MEATPTLTPRLLRLLALTCGASAASLWFAQPLLDDIASTLGVSPGAAGVVVAAAQVGYVAGLLLIVPRGDTVDRRRLVVGLLVLGAFGSLGSAFAPSLAVLVIATTISGLSTATAQVLVPLAGAMAEPARRGAAVGTVMSGVLIGILAARTASGLVAGVAGWHAVYFVSAALLAVLAVALWRALPDESARGNRASTLGALSDIAGLVRREPELRRRMTLGALGLGAFTLLWSALTLLLSSAPYRLGPTTIGLFGLAGLAGALAARRAGANADAERTPRAGVGWWLVTLAGWALCALGTESLVVLAAGLVVYDAGMQGQHVTNQTVLFERWPELRGRLATAYTSSCFAGGALGSVVASLAWSAGGWGLVCGAGAALAVVASLVVARPWRVRLRDRPARSAALARLSRGG